MGANQSLKRLTFEDMQRIIDIKDIHNIKDIHEIKDFILINTMSLTDQSCLIPKTVTATEETALLNTLLGKRQKNVRIVIYGRNCNDETVLSKHNQIVSLGFTDVSVYLGGMFEWLLLQDIYTSALFPTVGQETDLLRFKQ
jgi:hypothetical protein